VSVKRLVFGVITDDTTVCRAEAARSTSSTRSGAAGGGAGAHARLTLKPAVIQAQWVAMLDQWDPKSPLAIGACAWR
jgi:hypothetical protein